MAVAHVLSTYRQRAAEAGRNALAAATPAHRADYEAEQQLWLDVAVVDEKRISGGGKKLKRKARTS